MFSVSFLSVYLIRVSLILLLAAASEAQHYEGSVPQVTPVPDYDSDYNATFDYSFYSNASMDELEKFLQGNDKFMEPEEPEVTDNTPTTRGTTERSEEVDVYSAASLPVHLDFRTLIWTLMILQRII